MADQQPAQQPEVTPETTPAPIATPALEPAREREVKLFDKWWENNEFGVSLVEINLAFFTKGPTRISKLRISHSQIT